MVSVIVKSPRARPGLAHILRDAGLGEELEQLELAEGAQAEHGVVERGDLLDGDLAPCGLVYGGADDAICTLTNDV